MESRYEAGIAPEFQRGFVWKATQVRDLAESLWLDFPVGSLLLWNSDTHQEERVAKDGVTPALWIPETRPRGVAVLCAGAVAASGKLLC